MNIESDSNLKAWSVISSVDSRIVEEVSSSIVIIEVRELWVEPYYSVFRPIKEAVMGGVNEKGD